MAISVFPRVDVMGTNRWSPLRQGHWSTRGLLLCTTFGQGSSASRWPGTFVGYPSAIASVGATPQGMQFASTSHYIKVGNTTNLPLARATILCVRQCADTTLREGILFSTEETGTTNRCLAHVPYSDGTIYWDFGGSGVPGGRCTASFAKTTQLEAWAFIAGKNGSSIWRNGVRLGNQTTPCTARTYPTPVYPFRVNGSDGDVQELRFFAVLDAEWIAPQIVEWANNPWLMFGTASWRTVPGVPGLDTIAGIYDVTGSPAGLLPGGMPPGGQTYAWAYVG